MLDLAVVGLLCPTLSAQTPKHGSQQQFTSQYSPYPLPQHGESIAPRTNSEANSDIPRVPTLHYVLATCRSTCRPTRRGIRERKVISTPNRALTSDVQSNTAHAQAAVQLCCSSGADDTSHWRAVPV